MKVTPIEEVQSSVKPNANNNQGTNNSTTESVDNARLQQALGEFIQKFSQLDTTLNVTNSKETKTGGFMEEKVPGAITYVEPKSNKSLSGIKTREGGYSLSNIQKFDNLYLHTYREGIRSVASVA